MSVVLNFPIRYRDAFPTASGSKLSVTQTYLWLRLLLHVGPTVEQRDLAIEAIFQMPDETIFKSAAELDYIALRMVCDWKDQAEGHLDLVQLWAAHYKNVYKRSPVKLPWRITSRHRIG